MEKESQGVEEGSEAIIHLKLLREHRKGSGSENTRVTVYTDSRLKITYLPSTNSDLKCVDTW